MAITKIRSNALTSGVGADPNVKTDLARLGLRVFANQNLVATNSSSLSYDVFQDDSGIASNTNAPRNSSEYVSTASSAVQAFTSDSDTIVLAHMDDAGLTDSSSNNFTPTKTSGITRSSTQSKFGSYSAYSDGTDGEYWQVKPLSSSTTGGVGTGNFTMEFWFHCSDLTTAVTNRMYSIGNQGTPATAGAPAQNQITLSGGFSSTTAAQNFYRGASDTFWNPTFPTITANQWNHLAIMRKGTTLYQAINGAWATGGSTNSTMMNGKNMETDTNGGTNQNDFTLFARYGSTGEVFTGYMDEVRYSKVARYDETTSFTPNLISSFSATGNFISNTITAGSSTTKISAVINYSDNAGTNALNSDIILQLSADNGSNYSTATLTALPDFATGVKSAKVQDLTVTAGTQIKYKISFANQSSGSKEARIKGVSLQF